MSLDVPDLVRQSAHARGEVGLRWLESLTGVVAELADRWKLDVGPSLPGGTTGFVAAAHDADRGECVIKVSMTLDSDGAAAFRRAVASHRLAAGHGCARLIRHDEELSAMLLERLGPNLAQLGLSIDEILLVVATTLRSFWRPVDDSADLVSGAEKAAQLAVAIVRLWDDLGHPCSRRVVDRALGYCDERIDAFDPAGSVLVHGDAHGWNTLRAAESGYKFVDPEGLRSEPAHDLAALMREYNEPLVGGDARRLLRERAELLGSWCDADPEAIWQWGFIERVWTGLCNLRDFESTGSEFLVVAEACT